MIQIAKSDGLKVISSAGSDDKVKFMKECGADVAFNYKTTGIRDVLSQHGPINLYASYFVLIRQTFKRGVVISYWDHVGGDSLDAALEASDRFAHFVVRLPPFPYSHG